MTTPTDAGSFSATLWAETAGIRAAIDELPFVRELVDGTLDRATFDYYMVQDALYLRDYSRSLAALSSLAPTSEAQVFWATAAAEAIEVEMALHTSRVGAEGESTGDATDSNDTSWEPSPTCVMYTGFLISEATRGDYASLAAAVLPCFAVYHDVGTRLAARVRAASGGELEGHNYADWIATYEDPGFEASTLRAAALVDEVAAQANPETIARMRRAYITATRSEWMFWDAAHRQETWPV